MQASHLLRVSPRSALRFVLTPICAAVLSAHAAEPQASSDPQAIESQAAPPTLAAAKAADQADSLTVVVVQARKVKETLQTVPVAVTSYTGAELIKQGVFEFNEVARATPNVMIRAHASGATASIIAIRGQVNNDLVGTVDSPVGVYIDGVVAARPTGLNAAMVDLASVETLKGPQGTLFGRNTTGGAMLINTNDPEDEFSASISGELGSDNLRHATGVINVPLQKGVAAMRFVVDKYDRDGYVTDRNGHKWNDSHSKMARIKLLLKPSATSSIVFTGEYQDADGDVIAQAYVPGETPRVDGLNAPSIDPTNSAKQRSLSVIAKNEFDWGVVKLIAGARKLDTLSVVDLGAIGAVLANTTQSKPDGEQKSIELQASGKAFGGKLSWTTGLYAFKENASERQITDYNRAVIGVLGTTVSADVVSKSRAAFVQGSYSIFDKTNLTVGVRHSSDTKSLVGDYLTRVAPGFNLTGTGTGGEISFSNNNYLLSLDHSFTPDLMIYASRSTGYRAGGFNINETFSQFMPEDVVNTEVGAKTEWLGRKLRINAALYHQDYQNFQASFATGSPPVRVVQNANGRIRGGEIEVSAVPARGVRAGMTYGLTDTEYTSTALSGKAFTNIPRSTASLYASYRVNLPMGAWESRIDYSRTSAINYSLTSANLLMPAFELVNLRSAVEAGDWTVALWVKNAANKRYYATGLNAIGNLAWVGMPRTAGISASYEF